MKREAYRIIGEALRDLSELFLSAVEEEGIQDIPEELESVPCFRCVHFKNHLNGDEKQTYKKAALREHIEEILIESSRCESLSKPESNWQSLPLCKEMRQQGSPCGPEGLLFKDKLYRQE